MSPNYLNISRELLNDFKNYAARDERQLIIDKLNEVIDLPGIEMAIKIISEIELTDYNEKDFFKAD